MHDSAATTSDLPADDYDYDYDIAPARRMPRTTLALLIGVLIAGGFASGVLVQKRHDKGLGSSASALPAGFPTGGFPGANSANSANSANGATTGTRAATSGPVLVGTVVSVSGTTITVKDLGGTTHTVATTATTTVAKQEQQKLTDLTAGQTVSVNGTKADDGSVTATAVTLR
jgi:hypothetical protein